jgi:hypothetical protein
LRLYGYGRETARAERLTIMVKTSVGLEIVGGTLRIAAVRSFLSRRRLLGTFEIAGFESLPPSERRQRLSSLRQKHRLPGSRVHLVLPPDAGLVRQLELPSEVRDKLADVVGHQMEGLSPWPVDQIYWAYSTSRPAKAARTFSVTIVIIPRATMDARVELFRSAGFPLRGVTMSSGALAAGASLL